MSQRWAPASVPRSLAAAGPVGKNKGAMAEAAKKSRVGEADRAGPEEAGSQTEYTHAVATRMFHVC